MPRFLHMAHGLASACGFAQRLSVSVAIAIVLGLGCLACSPAYGDVGVVLNESLDTSVARITGSGHSAIYFSRICPESPVRLRLCHPDEQGSVMSNYTTLGEDEPFEWNAVPLNVYLYGVENAQNRPLFGSRKIKHVLEERYRERYLSGYCEKPFCRTSNNAEWREMVGATLSRSIYIFVVDTTVEQDLKLIAEFNSLPNTNHFNGFTRNCADFTRRVINTYFPGATKRDYMNDFGMSTPKAIARYFSHYAEGHPELRFRALHFAQLPGTIKRSSECRAGTEQLFRSKKLLIPMLVFAGYGVPVAAASYTLTGRFNPEHELEQHPSADAAALAQEIRQAKSKKDRLRAEQLETLASQESARLVGTAQEWKQYRDAFDLMVAEAVREEIIPDRDELSGHFKRLDQKSTPVLEPTGALSLEVSEEGKTIRVGISASNVLDTGSEPRLAHALVLARTEHVLKSPKHSREDLPEFRQDWALLEASRLPSGASVASSTKTPSAAPNTSLLPTNP